MQDQTPSSSQGAEAPLFVTQAVPFEIDEISRVGDYCFQPCLAGTACDRLQVFNLRVLL